jgi:hypothetical protein
MEKNIKLRNAMDALLTIYNLNFSEKKSKDWPWKKMKQHLLSFSNSIFDPDKNQCTYQIGEKKLNLVIDMGTNNISLPGIKIDKDEIRLLLESFDMLKQEVDHNIIHFSIKELNTHTNIVREEEFPYGFFKSESQILYELIERYLSSPAQKNDRKNIKLFIRLNSFLNTEPVNVDAIILLTNEIIKHNKVSDIDASAILDELKSVKQYLCDRKDDESIFKQMKKMSFNAIKTYKAVNVKHDYSILNAQSYSLITVEPDSLFAQKLIVSCKNRSSDNIDIDICTVHSLEFNSWKSFQEILKSFFVEYCFASDQFKNLKLCENRKCQKLMLEIRKNQKQFCSNKCRQAFFKQNPKNKCRDNQNQWIKEQFNSPELTKYFSENASSQTMEKEDKYFGKRIVTEDCSDCTEMVSRGHCKNIVIKNIELIDIEPKRKKKILKK